MFKVEIQSGEVASKDYDFTDPTGRRVAGTSRSQVGYLHLPGQPYPVEIKVKLREGQQGWPTGNYVVAPESFFVSKGLLAIKSALILKPMQASASRAA